MVVRGYNERRSQPSHKGAMSRFMPPRPKKTEFKSRVRTQGIKRKRDSVTRFWNVEELFLMKQRLGNEQLMTDVPLSSATTRAHSALPSAQ